MTFEEAGAYFVQLQAQYRSRAISPAQFQESVGQLRLQDGGGKWWQIEPESGRWMTWDGTQWTWPAAEQQAVPAPLAAYPTQPAAYPTPVAAVYPAGGAGLYPPMGNVTAPYGGQSSLTVPGKKSHVGIWEGFAPVLPGLTIGLVQNWRAYQKDPVIAAGFVVPSLLPALLVPLVPYIGRVVALLAVIGCLVWLSWPMIAQTGLLGNAKAMQTHAGRGLVGLSLLYLLPRIWRMK